MVADFIVMLWDGLLVYIFIKTHDLPYLEIAFVVLELANLVLGSIFAAKL